MSVCEGKGVTFEHWLFHCLQLCCHVQKYFLLTRV